LPLIEYEKSATRARTKKRRQHNLGSWVSLLLLLLNLSSCTRFPKTIASPINIQPPVIDAASPISMNALSGLLKDTHRFKISQMLKWLVESQIEVFFGLITFPLPSGFSCLGISKPVELVVWLSDLVILPEFVSSCWALNRHW
jgi:hypothetical protein